PRTYGSGERRIYRSGRDGLNGVAVPFLPPAKGDPPSRAARSPILPVSGESSACMPADVRPRALPQSHTPAPQPVFSVRRVAYGQPPAPTSPSPHVAVVCSHEAAVRGVPQSRRPPT